LTHSHHRCGDRKSLEGDFVLLSMVDTDNQAQLNYNGRYNDRIQRFLSICARHNTVGISARSRGDLGRLRNMTYWDSSMDSGLHKQTPMEEIQRAEEIGSICHGLFTDRYDLEAALLEIKNADLGISIVVSGIIDVVFDVCNNIGIEPHTASMSLGIWGKTELLPESPVLEICTMCGHAMISRHLAEKLLREVKKGSMTVEEAAVELGKQCTDNIFNTERGVKIIREYVQDVKTD